MTMNIGSTQCLIIVIPDANTFDSVVKFKNFVDIDKEYIKLDNDVGYWVFDTPFLDNISFPQI